MGINYDNIYDTVSLNLLCHKSKENQKTWKGTC